MTGQELVEALELTGTGEGKLEVARRVLRDNASASAGEVFTELSRAQALGKIGEGTVEKARRLMDGASVGDFQGVPPKNAEESRMRTLGKEIGSAITEQLRDRMAQAESDGIGGVISSARKK